MTPVIFRKWKDTKDIIALFPHEPCDCHSWYKVQSYMHVGQHSAADMGIVSLTTLATPDEYVDLLAELKRIGYEDLKVYKRETPQMRSERERVYKEGRIMR